MSANWQWLSDDLASARTECRRAGVWYCTAGAPCHRCNILSNEYLQSLYPSASSVHSVFTANDDDNVVFASQPIYWQVYSNRRRRTFSKYFGIWIANDRLHVEADPIVFSGIFAIHEIEPLMMTLSSTFFREILLSPISQHSLQRVNHP